MDLRQSRIFGSRLRGERAFNQRVHGVETSLQPALSMQISKLEKSFQDAAVRSARSAGSSRTTVGFRNSMLVPEDSWSDVH